MGDHSQSLNKILLFDSEQVLWRKGEIEFMNVKKNLKLNANNLL
jgi:hypothetical protein